MKNRPTSKPAMFISLLTLLLLSLATVSYAIGDRFTTLDSPSPGVTDTAATAPTSSGAIVGRYFTPDGVNHGFVLRDEEVSSPDVRGAHDTDAAWINARGDIVGPLAGQDTTTACNQAGLTTAEGIIKIYQEQSHQLELLIQVFDTYEAVSRFAPHADGTHQERVQLGETVQVYQEYQKRIEKLQVGCASYERAYSASDVRVMISQVRAHNLLQDLLRRVNELKARE